MTKTVSLRVVILLTAIASLVGGGIGAWLGLKSGERWMEEVSLTRELEMSGLCANGLKLNALQDRERLTKLLEMRLESALQHTTHLLDEGVTLGSGMPNLEDALRRVADYYTSNGDLGKAQSAQALQARLKANR